MKTAALFILPIAKRWGGGPRNAPKKHFGSGPRGSAENTAATLADLNMNHDFRRLVLIEIFYALSTIETVRSIHGRSAKRLRPERPEEPRRLGSGAVEDQTCAATARIDQAIA
jgi:hypothetical protein